MTGIPAPRPTRGKERNDPPKQSSGSLYAHSGMHAGTHTQNNKGRLKRHFKNWSNICFLCLGMRPWRREVMLKRALGRRCSWPLRLARYYRKGEVLLELS